MAYILNIDTSTEICSVALAHKDNILALKESDMGQSHAGQLTVFIEELLKKCHISPNQLDAVAVSKGPGSYTGLRIGVSTAKGICYALKIPLLSVCALQSLAHHVSINSPKYGIPEGKVLYCPMIDARRMEVYTALYDHQNKIVEPVSAKIITSGSFSAYLDINPVAFFGNGAAKCFPLISQKNAIFVDAVSNSAQFMCSLSWNTFIKKEFEDVAYFEPFYLKDFIATKPRNLLNTL